jgi:HK97 family phage prohead protease
MNKINVIVGPPCAGKSTYCREHAASGDVIVDYDTLAVALGASSPYEPPPAIRSAAFEARDAVIERVLNGVEADAWVIHTSPQPEKIARYSEAGATFTLLDPGRDECLARAAADTRPETTADIIEKWYANPPELPQPPSKLPKEGRQLLTKSCPVQIKAVQDGASDGIVEMIVSTYGVDSWGDRVMPGAFADTLAAWKAKGDPIPFIWSHRSEDPDMHVGVVLDAAERDADPATSPPSPAGLWVKAQLDMDAPKAAQVFRLLKARRVTQASFAYDILDSATVKENGDTINELRKLQLFEVGPTLIGMQQETELLNVKDAKTIRHILAAFKAGRVISAKNEELLRAAHESIGAVLSALDTSDDGKAAPSEPVKIDEPLGEKIDEPMRPRVAELARLEHDIRFAALGMRAERNTHEEARTATR